ncbi:MAG: hypothetical protein QXK47_02350 [Candidatus Bathyarchaeia archaeon]
MAKWKFWERKPASNNDRSPQYGVVLASSRLNRAAEVNTRAIMERLPLRWVAEGRVTEADLALAATTPVLGQYAPQFGWPDDWGLYWDYLDAYLFIPEVYFAVNLKNRMIWKPGWELEASSESVIEEFKRNWKRYKVYRALKNATRNALIWGNAYLEIVDDSEAKWGYGSPTGTALGAGNPRPLLRWKPASTFYGLKQIDSRTMRVFINPAKFDVERAEPLVEKYVQRRWTGPLGPTMTGLLGSNVEIDFHRDQIMHIAFNKVPGGIYGYSMYRSTIYVLKGYMIMLQYLPAIVQKRADPLLHLILGGTVKSEDGREKTYLPTQQELEQWKSTIQNRQPGEDIFTDALTTIQEVYKSHVGSLQGIQEYIQAWKERVLVGLGIPSSLFDIVTRGTEVKWGELKFEVLENEIIEYQEDLADKINEVLVPRLCSGEAEFHFNPITPEDWRANVEPMVTLYNNKLVSAEYVLDRLNIPQQARQGSLYQPLTGEK